MVGKLLTLMFCLTALLPQRVCVCGGIAIADPGPHSTGCADACEASGEHGDRGHEAQLATSGHVSTLAKPDVPPRHSHHCVHCADLSPAAALPGSAPPAWAGNPFLESAIWVPALPATTETGREAGQPPMVPPHTPVYLALRVLRI